MMSAQRVFDNLPPLQTEEQNINGKHTQTIFPEQPGDVGQVTCLWETCHVLHGKESFWSCRSICPQAPTILRPLPR